MIVALAGGVGGARLAVGLAQVLAPKQLAIVVNTGDDFEHHGLTVCPDIDTVVYTLSGLNNPKTGWGRVDESWGFMHALAALGGKTWFQLGDRDLAMHVLRTEALRQGETLSAVTLRLARRLGIRHTVVPMSDTPVRTRVRTARGEMPFQDYFVRLRCRPRVQGFEFEGARRARVPGTLAQILAGCAVDAWVIDHVDAASRPVIEAMGRGVLVADTMMTDRSASKRLANDVVRFARALAKRRAG